MPAKSLSEEEWALRDRLLGLINQNGEPMLECRDLVDKTVEGVRAYLGITLFICVLLVCIPFF